MTTRHVHPISVTINGETYERTVQARQLLVHFIRDTLGMKGTHIGCDTGNCGACSIIVNGKLDEELHDARGPGRRGQHGDGRGLAAGRRAEPAAAGLPRGARLQCGYCTPGLLMRATYLLRQQPRTRPSRRSAGHLKGNICRCTGYVNIVQAVQRPAAQKSREERPDEERA